MQFAENVKANWQEGYCFIITMPDPIQPKQPRRELVANVSLMTKVETEMLKWLRQQSKNFYAVGFDGLVKQWDKCINVGGGYVEK
jgi:hypothetical protein